MTHVVITGTSGGIGKAVAELYLSQGYKVTGISRNHTITHPDYTPVVCDLSDKQELETFSFDVQSDILLINNAGILGQVKRLSDQSLTDIDKVMAVNLVAPAVLMQRFAQWCGERHHLTVVNISSGAAKRAIPSWAAYCASKAALEMLSETFYLEEKEKGRGTKVYAVAPGVVNTNMQAQIRSVDAADFTASSTFHDYYHKGELSETSLIARKIQALLRLPFEGIVSGTLRDISEDVQ